MKRSPDAVLKLTPAPAAKKAKTSHIINLVDDARHAKLLTMPFWADNLYRDPKLPYIGKLNLEKLFMEREWTARVCGLSGYRLFHKTKASIQLRGADNNLARIAWGAEQSTAKKRNKTAAVELDNGNRYFGRDGGKQRGLDVHKEIDDFIKMPPAQFLASRVSVDPLTKAVLDAIQNRKLRAIASEVNVFDMEALAGTGIDIVCMNPKGEVELIELKTGYTGSNFVEVDEHTLSMLPPFSNIKDTPLNRARMQLLYGSILLEKSHGVAAAHHWVVHATPDTNTAVVHGLGSAVWSHRQTLLAGIRYERQLDTAIKASKSEYKKYEKKQRVGADSSKALTGAKKPTNIRVVIRV